MKIIVCFLLVCAAVMSYGQQQTPESPDSLSSLSFMKGDWAGKQNFDTGGGPAMVGDATDRIEIGIAGKYLYEMLSTTMPGRKPTDTRHFISYDKQSGKYTAWWFNDTSTRPTEFAGDLSGNKLVLTSNSAGPVLRATYESPSDGTLTFLLEMKQGDEWVKLFLTTYSKKTEAAQR
ncbi:MAG TPA: DUF1579 family protein [Terracidiphilus sp.]